MMRTVLAAIISVAVAQCLSAADATATQQHSVAVPPAAKLKVFVSILPESYFVERIGGTHVDCQTLVGPGQSPHIFEPTPREIARLADARLFFRIGWPFEVRLLEKAAAVNPTLKIIDLRNGITLRWMTAAEAHHDEQAAEKHEHAAGDADPHSWLNPRNAAIMAATIARALEAADPAHAADYQANLRTLQADLAALDAKLAATLAPLKGRQLFVYHPAFGYFADAYGLKQVPVEVEGKEPTARQLAALVDRARAAGARVIFVQPQFSARNAEAVAKAIGGAVVPFDDLAKDYIANLSDMADKVRTALEGQR
jgi:zinc transport system substrate-binding protein